MKAPDDLPARGRSIRESIAEALRGESLTAHEISRAVGISEKDVAVHLDHVERSAHARGERLIVVPAMCAECGFVFAKRARHTRPSACPVCRGQRIAPPAFRLA